MQEAGIPVFGMAEAGGFSVTSFAKLCTGFRSNPIWVCLSFFSKTHLFFGRSEPQGVSFCEAPFLDPYFQGVGVQAKSLPSFHMPPASQREDPSSVLLPFLGGRVPLLK